MAGDRVRSMEEFAQLSGISRPTLSKYFNDPASVRASTRARIEAALSAHDYRPNLFAVNQNRRATRIVGLMVPHIADPFFAEIIRLIEGRCLEQGFWAIVLSAHGAPELEARAIETLRALKPAGAIIAPLGAGSDAALIAGFAAEVPVVMLDARLGENTPFVGTDNGQTIGAIVDYLCRSGDRPCFLEMPAVNANAGERRAAYVAAMTRLGQAPLCLPPRMGGWDFEEIGYQELRWRLSAGALPSRTVLCANDRMAIGALAAASEAGLKVGIERDADLRIAGHDDHPLARFTCPSLTTVAQDFQGLAERSMDLLLPMVEAFAAAGTLAPAEEAPVLRLEGKLMLRGSA